VKIRTLTRTIVIAATLVATTALGFAQGQAKQYWGSHPPVTIGSPQGQPNVPTTPLEKKDCPPVEVPQGKDLEQYKALSAQITQMRAEMATNSHQILEDARNHSQDSVPRRARLTIRNREIKSSMGKVWKEIGGIWWQLHRNRVQLDNHEARITATEGTVSALSETFTAEWKQKVDAFLLAQPSAQLASSKTSPVDSSTTTTTTSGTSTLDPVKEQEKKDREEAATKQAVSDKTIADLQKKLKDEEELTASKSKVAGLEAQHTGYSAMGLIYQYWWVFVLIVITFFVIRFWAKNRSTTDGTAPH
jgi:hypothetical protein